MDLTILCPTFNRPKYLHRFLEFLHLMNNPFPVLIIDGSNLSNAKLNKEIVSQYARVKILQFDESLHQALRYFKGLKQIATPYVVFAADDDILIPSGLSEAYKFIQNNPE